MHVVSKPFPKNTSVRAASVVSLNENVRECCPIKVKSKYIAEIKLMQ